VSSFKQVSANAWNSESLPLSIRGEHMKRAAVISCILTIATWVPVQCLSQSQPSTGQSTSAPAAGQATPAGAPAAKRPPQAKTQPEYDAWKAAAANTDPAAMEKAADDFASKYPDSELRVLLYKNAMRSYQNANTPDKIEAMGRKVITLDPDDPEALISVAEVIAERTRDTDIDKDQRYAEGIKLAQRSLQTIDTDVSVPAGATQQQVDAYKASLRSRAYSAIGSIEYNQNNFAAAQGDFQKAIDAVPNDPYALDVLHLALSIDKQATAETDRDKQRAMYTEALKVANRAVDMTKENTPLGTPARHERDRLQQLIGASAPATSQPPKN
jgi:tetratricopeptide (TPR) repeat protein